MTNLVAADEMTVDEAGTDRLALEMGYGPVKKSRWWAAPLGSPLPGGGRIAGLCIDPWPACWTRLNEPAADMVGIGILDQDDQTRGVLIFEDPTPAMAMLWEAALPTQPALMLGAERGVGCPPPGVDYRAVFHWVTPLPALTDRQVRWKFQSPQWLSGDLQGLPAVTRDHGGGR